MGSQGSNVSSCGQRGLIRLGGYLSHRWGHRLFCWFCHVAAHVRDFSPLFAKKPTILIANSEDLDQLPHFVASYLDLGLALCQIVFRGHKAA